MHGIVLIDFVGMTLEETSTKNKTVKGKKYVLAGILSSMAYKKISSLKTNKSIPSNLQRNSSSVVAQALLEKVPQKSSTMKKQGTQKINVQELVQQVAQNSSTLKVQAMQKQVQQLPRNYSTAVGQGAKKQLQQVLRDSSIVEAIDVQVQMQQYTLNSGENEQSGQQGKYI